MIKKQITEIKNMYSFTLTLGLLVNFGNKSCQIKRLMV